MKWDMSFNYKIPNVGICSKSCIFDEVFLIISIYPFCCRLRLWLHRLTVLNKEWVFRKGKRCHSKAFYSNPNFQRNRVVPNLCTSAPDLAWDLVFSWKGERYWKFDNEGYPILLLCSMFTSVTVSGGGFLDFWVINFMDLLILKNLAGFIPEANRSFYWRATKEFKKLSHSIKFIH